MRTVDGALAGCAGSADRVEGHIVEGTEPVFVDVEGNWLHKSNLYARSWAPAIKAAKLEGFRFHDLRHSHATSWLAHGGDVRTPVDLFEAARVVVNGAGEPFRTACREAIRDGAGGIVTFPVSPG